MSLERTPSNTTTLYSTTSRTSTIVPAHGQPADRRPLHEATGDRPPVHDTSADTRRSLEAPKLGKGVTQAKIDELVAAGFQQGQVLSTLHASKGDMTKARLVLTHGRDHLGAPDEQCTLCGYKPKKKGRFMGALDGIMIGGGTGGA
ncbi:uncharacterized protein LOC62_07G009181 [Vanrija pseudolonga]|uniref:UBA domain-containing protein n=1 Tax=Vanrija pseudolonga TaxID=143232 RepID=A0AAF0YF52_9TREE|nr:hypothetical protein LOC62_07G009181 [Vanrija pseudolonga]